VHYDTKLRAATPVDATWGEMLAAAQDARWRREVVKVGAEDLVVDHRVHLEVDAAVAYVAGVVLEGREVRGVSTIDARGRVHLEADADGTAVCVEATVDLGGRLAALGDAVVAELLTLMLQDRLDRLAVPERRSTPAHPGPSKELRGAAPLARWLTAGVVGFVALAVWWTRGRSRCGGDH